jgi:hypothetical protein
VVVDKLGHMFILFFGDEVVRSLLSFTDVDLTSSANAPTIVTRPWDRVVALGLSAFTFVARHGCAVSASSRLAALRCHLAHIICFKVSDAS